MTPKLSQFDPHDNGITAARLGLALMVVVSHVAASFGPEPLLAESHGRTSLGFLAVIGFFALSGFLLAGSRERTSVAAFLRNRALRIVPGYWLALGFSMLVATLCASMRSVTIEPGAVAAWVTPRLVFLGGAEDGAFSAAIGAGQVNSSLWTLGVEVLCYLVLAATPRRWLRPVAVGALVLLWAWELAPGLAGPGTVLMLTFTLGAAAWLWREWIPMTAWTAALAAAMTLLALAANLFPVAIVLATYAGIGLAWLPFRIERDLSYGVYVFARPIETLLSVAGLAAAGLPLLLAGTILAVLLLAFMSWTLVEKPALSLKSRRLRRPRPRAFGSRAPRLVAPELPALPR